MGPCLKKSLSLCSYFCELDINFGFGVSCIIVVFNFTNEQFFFSDVCKDGNGVGITGGPYKVEGDCSVYYMVSMIGKGCNPPL